MPEHRWAGLHARVTGSGRGIGQDMALARGQEGANVSGHDFHANDGACETGDAVLHEGVQAMAMQADRSRGRDRAHFVAQRVEKFGSIDRLVNTAGAIMPPAPGEPMRDDTWDQTRHVHVKSGDQLINAMAPGRRERAWGASVHRTSVYGMLELVP
jgi:3-oxoacyl-[acyl-carrier protein] reductase